MSTSQADLIPNLANIKCESFRHSSNVVGNTKLVILFLQYEFALKTVLKIVLKEHTVYQRLNGGSINKRVRFLLLFRYLFC